MKFNQGKYEKAETFFLDALRLIPESNDEALDRVKQKLARVMEMKVVISRQPILRHTQSHMGAKDTERMQTSEVKFAVFAFFRTAENHLKNSFSNLQLMKKA